MAEVSAPAEHLSFLREISKCSVILFYLNSGIDYTTVLVKTFLRACKMESKAKDAMSPNLTTFSKRTTRLPTCCRNAL